MNDPMHATVKYRNDAALPQFYRELEIKSKRRSEAGYDAKRDSVCAHHAVLDNCAWLRREFFDGMKMAHGIAGAVP